MGAGCPEALSGRGPEPEPPPRALGSAGVFRPFSRGGDSLQYGTPGTDRHRFTTTITIPPDPTGPYTLILQDPDPTGLCHRDPFTDTLDKHHEPETRVDGKERSCISQEGSATKTSTFRGHTLTGTIKRKDCIAAHFSRITAAAIWLNKY